MASRFPERQPLEISKCKMTWAHKCLVFLSLTGFQHVQCVLGKCWYLNWLWYQISFGVFVLRRIAISKLIRVLESKPPPSPQNHNHTQKKNKTKISCYFMHIGYRLHKFIKKIKGTRSCQPTRHMCYLVHYNKIHFALLNSNWTSPHEFMIGLVDTH